MTLDPVQSLTDLPAELPAELADEPMESYAATATATVSFDANWRVYADNWVEGYHIPDTHPSFHAATNFDAFETTAHCGYVRMTAPPRQGLFYRGKWLWCARISTSAPRPTASMPQGPIFPAPCQGGTKRACAIFRNGWRPHWGCKSAASAPIFRR